jgi:hypothetical protein
MRISFNVELNFEELKKKFEIKNRQSKFIKEKDYNLPALNNHYRNTQTNINKRLSYNSVNNFNESDENNNNLNIINNNHEKRSSLNINNSSNQSVNNSIENNLKRSIDRENNNSDSSNLFESKNGSIYSGNVNRSNEVMRKVSNKNFFNLNKKESIENVEIKSFLENDNKNGYNKKNSVRQSLLKQESIRKNPKWFNRISQSGSNISLNYSEKRSSNNTSPKKSPGKTWFRRDTNYNSNRQTVKEINEDDYCTTEYRIKPYEDKNAEFFASLNKPKRHLKFNIFTERNKNEEEIQELTKKISNIKLDSPKISRRSMSPKKPKNKSNTKNEFSPIVLEPSYPFIDEYGRKTRHGKAHSRESYSNSVKKRNRFKRNKRNEKKYIKINSIEKHDANNNDKDDNGRKRRQKLPKIKQKLQSIYKVNPTIEKNLRSLKNTNQLTGKLEDYQQKLMNIAKNFLNHDNLKDLGTKLKEVTELSSLKDKLKYHKSINRWEIMVKQISRFIPEYLVETLKAQK